MNGVEIARLAAAVNLLRSDWPVESVQTFIANHLARRPYRDAAVAMVYVATDQRGDGSYVSGTPRRALTQGPWWRIGEDDPPDHRWLACGTCRGQHQPNPPDEPGLFCRRPVVASGDGYIAAAREALGLCPACRRDSKCPEHTSRRDEETANG